MFVATECLIAKATDGKIMKSIVMTTTTMKMMTTNFCLFKSCFQFIHIWTCICIIATTGQMSGSSRSDIHYVMGESRAFAESMPSQLQQQQCSNWSTLLTGHAYGISSIVRIQGGMGLREMCGELLDLGQCFV